MISIVVLYLLYGLTFFTLGVAILSRDIRLSELGIARIIWLLALFGIIHGFHEWLELLELLFPVIVDSEFKLFRLAVVSSSFLFLFYFGLFLNLITFRGDRTLQNTPKLIKALVGFLALSLIAYAFILDLGSNRDIYTRYLIAFPGGLLSGVGLILYSRKVRTFSSNAATQFILAGSCMIAYAVLSGLVPSEFIVPVIGAKVILFRGISGFFIMFFTIRALSVFSIEQRDMINEKLQRFAQSEKLASMGILAAGIAHEINNPLANISLNVEMLKDSVGEDKKISKRLGAIERNIDRASRIAKELLHFSREKETDLLPTDLNKLIESVSNLIKHQQLSTIIQLNLQDVPQIWGIPWKLEEVFINLLLNSLDACSQDDSVRVATFFEGGCVVVIITDTGHGVKEEHLTKVFDPFFTTKEVGKGTGLGLSVCYNIIQQHGGVINLDRSDKGGTTVTISFPGVVNDF